MLYININSSRQYLGKELVEKYGLKQGMRTPNTGYKIFEDNEKEEKVIQGNPQIYPAPEDDNSQLGQGQG